MQSLLRSFTLMLIALGLGCASTREHEQPIGQHFSILTHNVAWHNQDHQMVVEQIKHCDADIAVLQETTEAWEETLRAGLAGQYKYTIFHEFNRRGGGMAVLSRVPIVQKRWAQSSAGMFPNWELEAATAIGRVRIIAVHLTPPVDEQGRFSIDAYMDRKIDRRQEMADILAHMDDATPTILLGDFNEPGHGAAVQLAESRGFTNALYEFDRDTPTWSMNGERGLIRSRPDHILYDADLHCFSCRALNTANSDHRAVLAVFGKND